MERINPAGLPLPSGFSHAVLATGSRLVFLAGQTGVDEHSRMVGGGLVAQFEQALASLLAALRAAGGQPADLASLTVYACDLAAYREQAPALGGVWRRLVGPDYPAMAAVEVSRLWNPEALVELQGQAVLP
jgi:enamine deaminase RidA (YjgF/YER057c/UK114 family)